MNRIDAVKLCNDELTKHGLEGWGVRLNQNADGRFLGLCSYRDKVIILNAHHIDIHPDPDVINTIRHEVAHALTPGCGHNDEWIAKAREVGCDNTSPCSNLSLSPDIIDAIRSGATVEVTFDEEIIRKPKYTITRLQDKCEYCGKVAKSKSETLIENKDATRPDLKIITLECGHTLVRSIPKGTPFHLLQMGGDPNCEHEWKKNTCLKCDRKRPYDFQLEGMKFLEAGLSVNKGAAVFDEMGLGKTIQAGGVIKFHPEWWPVLWVVKSGLKYQFAVFLIQWLGDDHVPQVINSSKDFLIPGLKHYIIGYDMLVPKMRKMKSGKTVMQGFDITKFDQRGIKLVVLDECQQIKNPDSSRTQMVRRLVKDKKVLPLSGTPWKNRGSELYPVFNMMDPMRFSTQEGFKRRWVHSYWVGNRLMEGGIYRPEEFREYTKDICIRRERVDVLPELPLVNRTKLFVTFTPQEEEVYDEAVEAFVKWYEEEAASASGMHILGAMARMRHLIAQVKIPTTLEYCEEFVEDTDRKLVIFAHHIDVQQILVEELKQLFGPDRDKEKYPEEIPILHLPGGMDAFKRNQIQEQFNSSQRVILVASQLAAGEGLNLQTCCDCLMHERQWNPGNEEQAEGRFIRIGSTATSVNSVYTEAQGLTAIDQNIDGIVSRKRVAFHNTMNKGKMPTWNQESFAKELADCIVRGHYAKKGRKKAS